MRAVFLLLAFGLFAGCDNSCQSLCVQLAAFSEECGRTISESELNTCLDDFTSPTSDELQTCRDFGQPEVIRREWTCDDLNLYRNIGQEPSTDDG